MRPLVTGRLPGASFMEEAAGATAGAGAGAGAAAGATAAGAGAGAGAASPPGTKSAKAAMSAGSSARTIMGVPIWDVDEGCVE